ncbi:MAG: hypothetical protein J6C29_03525 [Clostridia bacterium]|nr:hypothetical protein [Clostridia bacterium]
MRRRNRKSPIYIIYFGVGLIVAFFCPLKVIVLVLAIAMIYMGICCMKC